MTIKICMGSSCFARENAANLEIIESWIKENKLEGKVEIVGSRCENMCAQGPNIKIDDVQYHSVNADRLKEILKGLV